MGGEAPKISPEESRDDNKAQSSFPSLSALDNLLKGIQEDTLKKPKPLATVPTTQKTTFDSEINKQKARKEEMLNNRLQAENERLQTENENLSNDQKLKSRTLILLFILLSTETAVIFVLSFLQGFKTWGFNLDQLTLRIVVVATLLQISAMLTLAVRHLFPAKDNHQVIVSSDLSGRQSIEQSSPRT